MLLFSLIIILQFNFVRSKRNHSFTRRVQIERQRTIGFGGLSAPGEDHINYQDGCAHYCDQTLEETCHGAIRCPFGEILMFAVRTTSMSVAWEGTCDIENVHHSHSLCCNQSIFKAENFHPSHVPGCEWYGYSPFCLFNYCPEGTRQLSEGWQDAWSEPGFGWMCWLGTKVFCCNEDVFKDPVVKNEAENNITIPSITHDATLPPLTHNVTFPEEIQVQLDASPRPLPYEADEENAEFGENNESVPRVSDLSSAVKTNNESPAFNESASESETA